MPHYFCNHVGNHLRAHFDLEDRPEFDLSTGSGPQLLPYFKNIKGHVHTPLRMGFSLALRYTLRLRAGALLVMGPPCSSFVFINQGTARRSEDAPYGQTSIPHVALGN